MEDLVDGMTEGIQEEFATIKFELDNGIAALKKKLDEKLSDLKKEFDQELISLKTDLQGRKKIIGSLNYGIFEVMFVMVLVFISNHI
jgi:hypothetical protein